MLKQVAAIAGVLLLSACGGGGTPASTPSTSPTTTPTVVNDPAKLTLGVWGDSAMVSAWTTAANAYNASTDLADVTVTSWPTDEAMSAALANPAAAAPDVFLISRGDLEKLQADKRVEPVDTYLDARNVDTGDQYSRDALEAFSSDHRLQCMPYGVAAKVVYYNTDLVNFPRMQAEGIDVPRISSSKSWTWNEFQLAAEEAAKVAGVHPFAVAPTLAGIAPFVLSAGGTLAASDSSSLSLSDSDTLDALGKVLPVFSNAQLTTTASEAKQLRWFEHGKLAMMVGDRSLTPTLRGVKDLRWDVLPIPSIVKPATTGDFTALCLSSKSERPEDAADLLVALSSETLVKTLAATGEIVPVNQQVALSKDFLQPDLSPLHSQVFVNTVRHMEILPLTQQWASLETAVASQVSQLFVPGQLPVAISQTAQQIDAASQTILAPTATQTATPTP